MKPTMNQDRDIAVICILLQFTSIVGSTFQEMSGLKDVNSTLILANPEISIERDSFSYALCDDHYTKNVSVCGLFVDSYLPRRKSHQACENVTFPSSGNPWHDEWGHITPANGRIILPKMLHGNSETRLIAQIVNMKDCNTRHLSFRLGRTVYYEILSSESSIAVFYNGGLDDEFRLIKETFDGMGNPLGKPLLFMHDASDYISLRPISLIDFDDGYFMVPHILTPKEIQVRNWAGVMKRRFEFSSEVHLNFLSDERMTFFTTIHGDDQTLHIVQFDEVLNVLVNRTYANMKPEKKIERVLSVKSGDIFLITRENDPRYKMKSIYYLEKVSNSGERIISTSIAENSNKKFYDSADIYQIDIGGQICIIILFRHDERVWVKNTNCFTQSTLDSL